MNLIKIEQRDIKHFGKLPLANELHIKEPSQFELEQAIARAKLNELDTVVIFN